MFINFFLRIHIFPVEQKKRKNKTKLVLSDGEKKKFDHNFFEALKQKHLENYEDALVLFEKCIKN